MQILVTGVGGLIGSHLADELLSQGHTVIGIDNFSFIRFLIYGHHRRSGSCTFCDL